MTVSSMCKRAAGVITLALAAALMTATAFAADPQTTNDVPTLGQLQQGLEQRDALIRELLRRVDTLQREVSVLQNQSPAHGAGSPTSQQAQQQTLARGAQQTQGQPQPAAQPASQSSPPTANGAQQASSAPGAFAVNPEAAQHALERALVQTGGLLLPRGAAEIVPTVSYIRREIKTPGQLALTSQGKLFATQDVFTSNQAFAGATLRAGLPWESQLQLTAPYAYTNSSTTVQLSGAGLSTQSSNTSGYGGTDITFTKQILHEGDWVPNLLASVGGHVNAGQAANLVLGTGFDQVNGSIFATKRQDPLVFTAGFSYVKSFERDNYQPGDEYIPSVGFLFAVSPETSFQVSTQVAFQNGTKYNGIGIPGSDQVQGLVQFGVLSILGPGLVVDLAAAVGVTPDAPNFGLTLSFPTRFNTGF